MWQVSRIDMLVFNFVSTTFRVLYLAAQKSCVLHIELYIVCLYFLSAFRVFFYKSSTRGTEAAPAHVTHLYTIVTSFVYLPPSHFQYFVKCCFNTFSGDLLLNINTNILYIICKNSEEIQKNREMFLAWSFFFFF